MESGSALWISLFIHVHVTDLMIHDAQGKNMCVAHKWHNDVAQDDFYVQ